MNNTSATATPTTRRRKAPVTAMKAAKAPVAKSTAAPKRSSKPKAKKTRGDLPASSEERWRMIAVAAYYRAEARGFACGHEDEDWRAAEAEIDQLLGA